MAAPSQETQVVTCGLGDEVFAVPVVQVREILDYARPSRIPAGPDFLLGLTNVRGQGVPTLDMRLRLGLPAVEPTLQTRILVLEVPLADRMLLVGLVLDRVFEVLTIRTSDVEPAPDIGIQWRSEFIAGVLRREDGFVLMLDLPKLFDTDGEALGLALGAAA